MSQIRVSNERDSQEQVHTRYADFEGIPGAERMSTDGEIKSLSALASVC